MINPYMIGQRVIYQGVICTVCNPETLDSSFEIWISNPSKGYSHGASIHSVSPLPGGQL